jgi:hypothetical protein
MILKKYLKESKHLLNTYIIDNSLKMKTNIKILILNNKFLAKVIIILYLFLYFLQINNSKNIINTFSLKIKNKGFLNITTIHKSKFTFYNYADNIIVYKDLYENITYIPINENNTIRESFQISKENYFALCENKTLLDNTKYKRNNIPKISIIIPYYNKDKYSLYVPLRSIQNQSFKDIEIIFVDDGSSEKKINQLL